MKIFNVYSFSKEAERIRTHAFPKNEEMGFYILKGEGHYLIREKGNFWEAEILDYKTEDCYYLQVNWEGKHAQTKLTKTDRNGNIQILEES